MSKKVVLIIVAVSVVLFAALLLGISFTFYFGLLKPSTDAVLYNAVLLQNLSTENESIQACAQSEPILIRPTYLTRKDMCFFVVGLKYNDTSVCNYTQESFQVECADKIRTHPLT